MVELTAGHVNMAKTQIHDKPLSEATSEKLKVLSYPSGSKTKIHM